MPKGFFLLPCPVCLAPESGPFGAAGGRGYWRCPECEATFLDPSRLPSREAERERYLLHRNDPSDRGYRAFLERLAGPLLGRLPPHSEGLDYGSGPAPALAGIIAEAGHSVEVYDPFFFDRPEALARTYDFISCSETAEHFHRPAEEFARLDGLLRPGGWLGVMTAFLSDDVRFEDWHYRTDPTHVVFYREETFRKLAARFGWSCEFPARDIVLLRKSPD